MGAQPHLRLVAYRQWPRQVWRHHKHGPQGRFKLVFVKAAEVSHFGAACRHARCHTQLPGLRTHRNLDGTCAGQHIPGLELQRAQRHSAVLVRLCREYHSLAHKTGNKFALRPSIQIFRAAALGNYAVQVDNRRNDELGDLARDFNHMAEEVQHAVQMQRDLLANVSHDLRTPLTLIKGYAETVRDITGDDKAHRDEQMNIIVDEADRLTALVSSVMELSKVTSGADKCERVHFDMGQLCDEVSERYDAICAQNGWQLQLELPEEELPVYADPDMMQRALHNLLGNAMHHIGQDGIFILRAFRCSEGVRVEVEDHGPGIAAADLPYIFDRYYRSRSDAGKQGTGLGLSITKAIFQQHSFRFGVQSTVGKGTTFWFVMSDLPYVDDFEGK